MLSAGTLARRQIAQRQIDELGARVNWSLIAELLSRRRLLTLLGPRLTEVAARYCGNGFGIRVSRAVDTGRRHAVLLQAIASHVITALADAGIRCSMLKGPQLSEVLYGDPGVRPSRDIDLLVAKEQLHDAVEIVRGLEYMAPTDHVEDDGLPLLHFALLHERGVLPPVELHWRIHWYERSFAYDRLLPPQGNTPDSWRPAPIDELAALLLFYARDGFIDLRIATDIGTWWSAFGANLQPNALDELIHAYPAFQRVLLVTARVAQGIVGLPADQLTRQSSKLGARGRIAARLADPSPSASKAQLYADMGLIDGLLTPPGSFRAFLKRQVTPPMEVIREHAHKAHDVPVGSTLGYALRVLTRYGLALTRLLLVPWAQKGIVDDGW